MVYYVFRFLRLWSWFAIITIAFSLLVMCFSYNIFRKTGKNPNKSFIPIYNLLIMLDIVELSRLNFILLLFPIVNVYIIFLILYRLSIIFHTGKFFTVGLIFFSVVFLPMLNFGDFDNNTEDEKKDDVTEEMVSLLTEKQYNELNNLPDTEPKIDNVFKIQVKEEEPAPTFKANKIKYREMVLPEEKVEEIKRVEPVKVTDIYTNRFINTKVTEEDDSIEIVEL